MTRFGGQNHHSGRDGISTKGSKRHDALNNFSRENDREHNSRLNILRSRTLSATTGNATKIKQKVRNALDTKELENANGVFKCPVASGDICKHFVSFGWGKLGVILQTSYFYLIQLRFISLTIEIKNNLLIRFLIGGHVTPKRHFEFGRGHWTPLKLSQNPVNCFWKG